jgi:hypothetical protein
MATADEKLAELGHMATTKLGELPLSAHAIVLGVFVGGVILWLFGQKSMRLGFTLVGLFGGGFLGLVIPAAFAMPVPPLVGALIGGVLGLIIGATLFRATVATSLAIILAIVAPLVAAAAMGLKFDPDQSRFPEIELSLPDSADDKPDDAAELIEQSGQKLRAFLAHLGDDLRPQWEALPQKQRTTLIASAIVGALMGAGLGGLMPKRMAALMTGFVGAALLLPSGAWLLSAASSDAQKWLPKEPLAWIAVWVVLGVIGAFVQWGRSKRRADKQ